MGSEKNILLVRADASQEIGTGHVMRCLALAQAWQENGGELTVFAMAMKTPALESRLSSEGQQVLDVSVSPGSADDAAHTVAVARRKKAACIVVDGYHFGAEYQQIIKDAGLRLMVVDDFGQSGPYHADVLLNQNLYAGKSLYAGLSPHVQLLLGPRYVLLRQEFWPLRGWRRKINSSGRRVLVTLGGADPDNVTLKVIYALQQIQMDFLEAIVVVGGSNRHHAELQQAIAGSPVAIRLEHDAMNMPELMVWADLAVSAGGSTCWEIAFTGLPNLVMALDERQLVVARELESRGIAVNLGLHERISVADISGHIKQMLLSSETRSLMSARGQTLIDGKGGMRVVEALAGQPLKLRRAHEGDCEQLWKWANDPDARKSAFRSDFISWDEHRRWFSGKLKNPGCFIFIALDGQGTPVGQIRFDLRDGEAEVDVSIDQGKRGLGYGAALIRVGVQELVRDVAIQAIHAFVKPDNEASMKAFQKAGFKEQGTTQVQGCPSTHLIAETKASTHVGETRTA